MNRAGAAAKMAALVLMVTAACRVATVRPLDERTGAAPASSSVAGPFDAAAFVDSIWQAEVLGALERAQQVQALAPSSDGAAAASGAARHVVVRGRGRVVEIDTRSRSGAATVELEGGAGTVVLQLGPVLTGMAIRDALPALGFEHFANQLQHADVGNELNARVERQVLGGLEREKLRGRAVTFAGMARVEGGQPLTITPVRLALEPGP